MAISYTLIAILIFTKPPGGETGSAIIIYLTVLFFGVSYGPIPYSIIGEVLNMVGVWLSVVNLWAHMAIIVFVFPFMIDGMGIGGSFLFFVGTNILSIICILFLLKETKGLSPKEID